MSETPKQQHNRSKSEYIDILPEDVFEMGQVLGYHFDRYWVDLNNQRIIMKPKRGVNYKVVHPYYDKWNDCYYVNLIDVEGNQRHWRVYDLLSCFTVGYYLNKDYHHW